MKIYILNHLDICEPFDFIGEILKPFDKRLRTDKDIIWCEILPSVILIMSETFSNKTSHLSQMMKEMILKLPVAKLNDPGMKQWGDGSQSHQGHAGRISSQ